MIDPDRARATLVHDLLAAGRIRSRAVEDAFRTVPRHLFLPGASVEEAYADDVVTVQRVDGVATSSASQPSMVAIMLEQLDLRPGHRVLEIGAGTGWNAALIARIVGADGRVTTIDIDPDLVDTAADRLPDTVEVVCADGALGHPAGAPYDRIVLTVGSNDVWPAWVEQLAPGGRLLLPLTIRGSQLSVALDLAPDGLLHSDSARTCGFIRLRGLGATARPALTLADGRALHGAEDGPELDPVVLAAALDEPGEPLASAVALGPVDVWDGFGLWLALTEPGAGRLTGAGRAPSLLLAGDGIAVLAVPGDRPGPVTVQPYGPGGPACADRLLGALERWTTAGAPTGSDWRITVLPTGPVTATPAASVVRKEHCHLLLSLP